MLCPCLIFAGREFQILTPLNIIDCYVLDMEKKVDETSYYCVWELCKFACCTEIAKEIFQGVYVVFQLVHKQTR